MQPFDEGVHRWQVEPGFTLLLSPDRLGEVADPNLEVVGGRDDASEVVSESVDDLVTDRETDARARVCVAPVQTLERREDLLPILRVDPDPFVLALIIACACTLMTPMTYQTNLMVMGPGGYQPRDYLKVGAPLALLTLVTALLIIPWVWPFELPVVP